MKKIFFDHIYKAAGTTIDRILEARAGAENVTPGLNEPAANALVRFRHKQVITGHFSFSPGETLDPERYCLTVLRHPVERLLSHYYFCRADVAVRGANPAVELAKSLSLEAYLDAPIPEVRSLLENNQAWHFAPLSWDGSRQLRGDELLGAAKAALDGYDLVGVVKEIEDVVALLCVDHGWAPFPEVPRANATSLRPQAADVDPALIRRIESMNDVDLELWHYARALLQRRRTRGLVHLAELASGNRDVAATIAPVVSRPEEAPRRLAREYGTRRIEFTGVSVEGLLSLGNSVTTGEDVKIALALKARERVENVNIGIRIVDSEGRTVFGQNLYGQGRVLDVVPGEFTVEFVFKCSLGYGDYSVAPAVHVESSGATEFLHWKDEAAWISVIGNIGHQYEGYVKLEPRVLVHSPDPAHPVAIERDLPDRDVQQLVLQGAPLTEFRGEVEVCSRSLELKATEARAVLVNVRNHGAQRWISAGLRRVCICYHWRARDGTMVEFDGERTELVADIPGGETVRQWAVVKAPREAGTFVLEMTLVQEYVSWFDAAGCPPATLSVEILPLRGGGSAESNLAHTLQDTTAES